MHCFSLLLLIEADPNSLGSLSTQMMLRYHHLHESSNGNLRSGIVASRSRRRLVSASLLGELLGWVECMCLNKSVGRERDLTEWLRYSACHEVSDIRPSGTYDHGKTSINIIR